MLSTLELKVAWLQGSMFTARAGEIENYPGEFF